MISKDISDIEASLFNIINQFAKDYFNSPSIDYLNEYKRIENLLKHSKYILNNKELDFMFNKLILELEAVKNTIVALRIKE